MVVATSLHSLGKYLFQSSGHFAVRDLQKLSGYQIDVQIFPSILKAAFSLADIVFSKKLVNILCVCCICGYEFMPV